MGLRKAWFTLVNVAYDLFLKLNPRKLSAHAVIVNQTGQVLLLRSRYADVWMLPGGGLNRREHLDRAVVRECREELGVEVVVERLTGLYYYPETSMYMAAFRCHLPPGATIRLSHEHTEYAWSLPDALPRRIIQVVNDAYSDGPTVTRTVE